MRHDRAEIQSCKQCGMSYREASMKRAVTGIFAVALAMK
jgi:hypothetical protein